jgi:ribonuclease P protein component
VNLYRLRSRPDYLATSKGTRVVQPGFVLVAAPRAEAASPARFGFTVSRRVGNAVTRNRVRRRLKELARNAANKAAAGVDYVLIGRTAAVDRDYAAMAHDLATALARIAGTAASGKGAG